MKTIYDTCVIMESQEQCDRMKKLCIDNKLPYYNDFNLYMSNKTTLYVFFYCFDGEFCNYLENDENKTEITEKEFIELLQP